MKIKLKKGVMSEVIAVFILVLVISVIAGMTFLFTANLKAQTVTNAPLSDAVWVTTESLTFVNATLGGNVTTAYTQRECYLTSAVVYNATSFLTITSGNYTINSPRNCMITALDTGNEFEDSVVGVNYTYTYKPISSAERAVNGTEASGATLVNYLPLLFLAIIFGAILAVVLKIILPYINLGNSMGGGF